MHDKLADLGAQGILETINRLSVNPNLNAEKQDDSQSNYAKKITKTEAVIDWTMSATDIDQRIRAFTPWPICQTSHNGTRIRVWQASATSNKSELPSGTIITINDHSAEIACGQGTLKLRTLQRDGSKQLGIQEFCNGYPLTIGDCLDGAEA